MYYYHIILAAYIPRGGRGLRKASKWVPFFQRAAVLKPPLAANPQRLGDGETTVAWGRGHPFRHQIFEGLPACFKTASPSIPNQIGHTL